MPKSKVMELAIKIAGKVDKSLGTSTKAANKQLATIQKAANKVSTVMTAGLAAMGTGAIAATKYLTDLGGEWQTATNQVAAGHRARPGQNWRTCGTLWKTCTRTTSGRTWPTWPTRWPWSTGTWPTWTRTD